MIVASGSSVVQIDGMEWDGGGVERVDVKNHLGKTGMRFCISV